MNRFTRRIFVYTAGLLLASSLCHAEIYQWRDKDGNLHFGDKPPPTAETKTVKLKINSYQSVEVIDGSEWVQQRNQKNSKRVVMYTTTWCGACKKAKKYFRSKNIPFQEYDVENSEKGKRDFAAMKGTGVPIVLVGNTRMNGFSQSRFESIYYRQPVKSGNR